MAVLDNRRAYRYFTDKYVLSTPSSKGWYQFDCPFCDGVNKRSVHFFLEITKCWTCSFKGHIYKYVQEVEGISYDAAKDLIWALEPLAIKQFSNIKGLSNGITLKDVSKVKLPVGYKSLLQGDSTFANRARNYLSDRGFDLEKLDLDGFGYCNLHDTSDFKKDFFGYIIIPFKKDGVLQYYIGRDFIGNKLRYKNAPSEYCGVGKSDVIYNQKALYLYDTVYLTEGWADAETIPESGTATLGWSLSAYQLNEYCKSSAKRIVHIPDAGSDETGQSFYHKAVKAATKMMYSGKSIYVVNTNLLSEYGKDVNEIGFDKVKQLFKDTELLTLSSSIRILSNAA